MLAASKTGVSTRTALVMMATNPAVRAVLVVSWLLNAAYICGLPWWSNLLNSSLGESGSFGSTHGLCMVPPEDVTCSNGANAAELLKQTGRKFICGCGQGLLGEGICPTDNIGYSISSFIATAPGTGAMAMTTVLPCVGMWFTATVAREMLGHTLLLRVADLFLVAFQFLYLSFLVFATCVFPVLHLVAVAGFIAAAIVHFVSLGLAVFKVIGTKSWTARIILIGVVGGVLSLCGGLVSVFLYTKRLITWPYGFWLGECCGLLFGFGIPPALLVVVPLHLDIAKAKSMRAEVSNTEDPTNLPPSAAVAGRMPAAELEA